MDQSLDKKIIASGDGSHTIHIPDLKEHYHSHKGAIRESMHVFIGEGLKAVNANPVQLIEVGFGTGLNALLTALYTQVKVHYTSLEPFPLAQSMIKALNYPEQVEDVAASSMFESIHQCAWGEPTELTQHFVLKKLKLPLQSLERNQSFDLVYYDAFAPHAQPELWVPAIWEQLFELMNPGAVLVTYCAKAQVRRDMQAAGFDVHRLPGPPGKREMLKAVKPISEHG